MVHEIIYLNRERNVYMERFQLSNAEELSNIQRRPTVVVLPGGGYMFHSERESEPVALAYMAQGYNAFILHYSVADHAVWPNQLNDVEQALKMIRDNADAWQVDSNKICTIGFSAGGHLSVAVSSMGTERPNAQIVGYPAVIAETVSHMPTPKVPDLIGCIDKNTAPTFIFSTMEDELVSIDNSIRLIDALNKAGVPSEIHIFKRGCHGMSLATPHISNGLKQFIHPEIALWFEMSMNFLRDTFGEFPTENPSPHWKLVGGGLQ